MRSLRHSTASPMPPLSPEGGRPLCQGRIQWLRHPEAVFRVFRSASNPAMRSAGYPSLLKVFLIVTFISFNILADIQFRGVASPCHGGSGLNSCPANFVRNMNLLSLS
jgi:hypothetical protein